MGLSIEQYRNLITKTNLGQKKNIHRQIQGKINRELGKTFEEQIETLAEIYRLQKLAIIEKTPEPMKILKHIENGRQKEDGSPPGEHMLWMYCLPGILHLRRVLWFHRCFLCSLLPQDREYPGILPHKVPLACIHKHYFLEYRWFLPAAPCCLF